MVEYDAHLQNIIDFEFVDRADDLLGELERLIETGYQGAPAGAAFIGEIRRVAHSIKGLAASFQVKILADQSHELEDHLKDLEDLDEKQLGEVQRFIDAMAKSVQRLGNTLAP